MRTLTVTAVVGADHTLTVQVPADIPPGPHEVVIVFQENVSVVQPARFTEDWPIHQVGPADPTMTFRREDIYGDDAR